MSRLFTASYINNLELANRFVRSATWEGLAQDDGAVTDELIKVMVDLAKGGVGLMITGHAYVRRDGQAGMRQLGVYSDEQIVGLRKMTQAVHGHGGKIIMQISHAGRFAPRRLTGQMAAAVSRLDQDSPHNLRELSLPDMEGLAEAFGNAAFRAREAGFDGVQIHCAHGYLLSQFISPFFNRRRDEYGGSVANRVRVHLQVIAAVRRQVGSDYPLLVKLNGQDYVEGGLQIDESVQIGTILAKAGVDALELSGGIVGTGQLEPSRAGIKAGKNEAYFREEAVRFKKEVPLPLILVGGIRSRETAQDLLDSGAADYISMSRPFIYEPGLIHRWQSADPGAALCKSDNLCLKSGRQGNGVYCVVKAGKENR